MRRVLVIGSSGSGKSRLTTRLAEKLALPTVFLDVHYWRPGWQASDPAAWRQRVSELVEDSEWIMEQFLRDVRPAHAARRHARVARLSPGDVPAACPDALG
jgi:adenylate kinase family enzyme